MLQIVYSSTARAPFSATALDDLLAKARERNKQHHVTGMLLYHSGSFLQVLEGPEAGVNLIFGSIQRDHRHVTRLEHRQKIERREFRDWSMGFLDAEGFPQQPPAVKEFLERLPDFTTTPTSAKRYLRFFQKGLLHQPSLA